MSMKPADKSVTLVRNTSVLAASQIGGTIVMFLLTPFILPEVGIHQFGIWAFVGAFVAFTSLLNFGLGKGAARFIAVFGERGEADQIRRIVSYSVVSHLGVGLLALPIVWLLGSALILRSTIAG